MSTGGRVKGGRRELTSGHHLEIDRAIQRNYRSGIHRTTGVSPVGGEPEDPVLADRGWGYAALGRYLSDHEGTDIAWPAWIVIGPDMTVITGAVGFGSWDTIGSIIESDWEARGQTGPL